MGAVLGARVSDMRHTVATDCYDQHFDHECLDGHSWVMDWDVVVVGAGLAGLVAAAEAAEAGRSVLVLDQEGEQSLGGQAHWSFGGLFLVDSREQRRLGVRDSRELARHDWFGSAAFDR